MKIIIGLGNKGKEYTKTRHNIGFMMMDFLAEKYEMAPWKEEKKFFSQITFGQINNEKVILVKPQTFMNLSGKAIGALVRFYKVSSADIWVFYDDVDLNFGQIRYREKGSSGGHNGMKSLFEALGTSDFPRIKIGIANEKKSFMETSDFVLGRFTPEELEKIPDILQESEKKLISVGL